MGIMTITMARPYAQAIFSSAKSDGQLELWSSVLSLLSTVIQDAQFLYWQTYPNLPDEEMQLILCDIIQACGLEIPPHLLDKINIFLNILIEGKRLSFLSSIASLYHQLVLEEQGMIEAEVRSVRPLTQVQKKKLQVILAARFQGQVSLKFLQDPDLLGGLFIRVGNWVMDTSLQGRLRQLSDSLTHVKR